MGGRRLALAAAVAAVALLLAALLLLPRPAPTPATPAQPGAPQAPSSAALPPPITIDVWVGNTTVKTTVKPSEVMVVPFNATYEYVGNGWLHVKGGDWVLYIKMPPWKRIRVYLNYTAYTTKEPGELVVVVRNGPVYMDVGAGFYTIPLTAYTIDRGLVDLYNRALEENNFDKEKVKRFFYAEREFLNYFSCYDLVNKLPCDVLKTAALPSEKLRPGVSPGDLRISGSGEMWILVQVLEQ
jgi:hypothetical protein